MRLRMKASCCVDDDYICIGTDAFLHSFESHGSGIGIHALAKEGAAYPFGPYLELVDSGCPEGIPGTKEHGISLLFILVSKLADGGSLAYSIDAYDEEDIWFLSFRQVEVVEVYGVVFGQQACDFIPEDVVEFGGIEVLVAGDSCLDAVDDLDGGIESYIAGDQGGFEFVEDFDVDSGFPGYGLGYLLEEAGFGLFKALLQFLFLFLGKEFFKETHVGSMRYK